MEHLGDSNVIRKIHMLERYIYIYILKWIYCRLKYTRLVIVNHLTRLSSYKLSLLSNFTRNFVSTNQTTKLYHVCRLNITVRILLFVNRYFPFVITKSEETSTRFEGEREKRRRKQKHVRRKGSRRKEKEYLAVFLFSLRCALVIRTSATSISSTSTE